MHNRKHEHRRRRQRRVPPGAPPGTIRVHPGAPFPKIRVLRYSPQQVEETETVTARQVPLPSDAGGVLWVDVAGLGSQDELAELGTKFGLHALTLEDIVNTHQRPKAERFEAYQYIVLRAPSLSDHLHLTQLSVVVGRGFVVSFTEGQGEFLEPVRERIRRRGGVVCSQGADYLVYAILDAVTDYYFPLLDAYAERLDAIERIVLQDTTSAVLPQLYAIKEDIRECRRSVWPLRDLLNALMRDDQPLFRAETRLHLRDCQDHVNQLVEIIESDRDTATALMELHVSSVGNRMNEVMKVLTIIATLFIPLSFITGLYGMNFDSSVSALNMPELRWRWGYPAVLLLLASVAATLLLFFRRRGWLGSPAQATVVPPSDVKSGE